jgi:hypothetical protein
MKLSVSWGGRMTGIDVECKLGGVAKLAMNAGSTVQ